MENPLVAGVLVALLVPFLGNTLGAALVLFARHGMSERFTKALLGFAAGVMIAASVWSLIVPALEAAEGGAVPSWLPVGAGFLGGMFLLLAIDHFTPSARGPDEPEDPASTLKPTMMLAALAITTCEAWP
ncbi:MAG: ZIP family metal transporter [Coriobacteriaceae bacterium]